MHPHFKAPLRPENSSYLGFGREPCTSEISFRPCQRILCFAFLLHTEGRNIAKPQMKSHPEKLQVASQEVEGRSQKCDSQ